MLKRNDEVAKFRKEIIAMETELRRNEMKNGFYRRAGLYPIFDSLPTYEKMLYSSKKLTLENWLSEYQIKQLKQLYASQKTK